MAIYPPPNHVYLFLQRNVMGLAVTDVILRTALLSLGLGDEEECHG